MKVSVIIPAYNHEAYITAAVQSVLNQTFQEFEIIIVDDGSTDGTARIVEGFQDSRIACFRQSNQGAHRTLNRGIALASGEYVAILNSDDVYLPERLEKCITYLDGRPDVAAAISLVEGIDPKGRTVHKRTSPHVAAWLNWYANALPLFHADAFFPHAFSKNILITTSNIIARKSILELTGGFAPLRYAHDWDMLLKLSLSYALHLVPEKLLKYRIHDTNTVHEEDSEAKVRFEVNWLINKNIERLRKQGRSLPDLVPLLKQNHYVSIEALFMMTVFDLAYTCEEGFNLRDPITAQCLEILR